jgi:hypothetical protein
VSHSLDLCTVAEAVETAAQVAILREVGADVGQGYFFAPPLPADEALALTSQDALPLFSLSTPATHEGAPDPPGSGASSASTATGTAASVDAAAGDGIDAATVAGSADAHAAGGRTDGDDPSRGHAA